MKPSAAAKRKVRRSADDDDNNANRSFQKNFESPAPVLELNDVDYDEDLKVLKSLGHRSDPQFLSVCFFFQK